MKEDKLKQYLQKQHTPSTTYGYYRNILIYLKEQPQAEKASYKDIVNYVGTLRKLYSNGNSVKSIMHGIKKYYDYLIATNQRKDHPCRSLNIKDKLHKDVQLQDLLTEKELEDLLTYESKRFKPFLQVRDKALLGLLIYQGLTKGEIKKLTVSDLNLEAGSIYIKSSKTSNSRVLELKNTQIFLLNKYINETRPELLKRNILQIETDSFFITTKGKAEQGCSLKYMFDEMKRHQGRKITIQIIRQSVIALKLKKGNDIRIIQHFAGHKNPSSTERYKARDIEELKAGINKYHPLK